MRTRALGLALAFSLLVPLGGLLHCKPTSASSPDGGSGPDAGRPDAGFPRSDAGPADAGVAVTPRRIIYQLVVRTFSNTNLTRAVDGTVEQNGVGKFADINAAALSGLRELGVTDLWLTGVLRQATLTDHSDVGLPSDDPDVVKGRAGSFYAVRDYFDVSPDYAVDKKKRLEEFDALVARAHGVGLKVHIDLVPNHVARGYQSVVRPESSFGKDDDRSLFFEPQNHFYYLSGQGPLTLTRPAHWQPAGVSFDSSYAAEDASELSRTPRVTGLDGTSVQPSADEWYETVKLNYGVDFTTGARMFDPIPSTWQVMDEVLAYWQARGVDGFRCDFAHVVPHEAWRYLISRARSRNPDVYFFAEAYASLEELIALQQTGFDAIYHDEAVDQLKRLYQGKGTQQQLSDTMSRLDDPARPHFLHYLENHDERRVASPVVPGDDANATGFGGLGANYQLAPLLFLYSAGPVLLYNGQEVGETGAGREGFAGDDGRSSIFDYGALPELARWVNGHLYDGALLSTEQRTLRTWLRDLFALSQTALALGERYWGLEYFNQPQRFADSPDGFYSFARFQTKGGALLLVVANFQPGAATTGRLRVPPELADAAGLPATVQVRLRLGRAGLEDALVTTLSRAALASEGFETTVEDQSARVFELR